MEFSSLESILNFIPEDRLNFVKQSIYGPRPPVEIAIKASEHESFDIKGFQFHDCNNEGDEASRRQSRVALFQNSILEDTTAPVCQQKDALLELGRKALQSAAANKVQIFCFQECWSMVCRTNEFECIIPIKEVTLQLKIIDMPMFFCTQKKLPWVEFAEDAHDGPTTEMLRTLAKRYNMVIVSPILERSKDDDALWNSAVVISNKGEVLGVSRKNHIPISGRFSETYYYNPSDIGHPVFDTEFGRIAVSICYERHHPQSFLSYGINGAEIVFNPSATVKSFSESLWPVEARAAAYSNDFYVGAINRVGTETFSEDNIHTYYGSSYIAGPDGSTTPGLSVSKNSLLIADLDLTKCSRLTPQERLGGFIVYTEYQKH